MQLTIFFTIVTMWYLSGALGIYFLFQANLSWKYITRFQLFWIVLLWNWCGLSLWFIAIVEMISRGRPPESWNDPVFMKKEYRERGY